MSLCTSELSCFPKYMSEEMAFTSPNFIRASPGSTTGSGFLLDVGLKTVITRENIYDLMIYRLSIQFKKRQYLTFHPLML